MPITSTASGIKAGTVAHFAASTAPAGWLKANGALVSRATYAALFTAIGTTYGVGDGATTFGLPDLRGEFLRSLDDGRGIDSGRAIGTAQAGEIQSHAHVAFSPGTMAGGGSTWDPYGWAGDFSEAASTKATGGTETRPRNVAMLACIKF